MSVFILWEMEPFWLEQKSNWSPVYATYPPAGKATQQGPTALPPLTTHKAMIWLFSLQFKYVLILRITQQTDLTIYCFTLLCSSVSSSVRDRRPHCSTLRASTSNSLKNGQYEDRLTPDLASFSFSFSLSFSGWSCHNKKLTVLIF